VRANLELSDRQ